MAITYRLQTPPKKTPVLETLSDYVAYGNYTLALEAKHFEKPDDWDSAEAQEERRVLRELYVNRKTKSFKLREFIDPKLEANLPKNEKALMQYIARYRDRNINILSTIYIKDDMIFTDSDANALFVACGVDKDELQKIIDSLEKPPFVQEQKNITPFRVLMIFVVRYYQKRGPKTYYEMAKSYYEYNLYYSLYNTNFPHKIKNRAVDTMVYTIDNLQSGMILKKAGSIEVMMQMLANKVFDPDPDNDKTKYNYTKLWEEASDWGVEYLINQLKTRLNGQFSAIKKKFMENYKAGNVSYQEGDPHDEEGNVVEREFSSGRISQLTDKYVTKFFVNTIDRDLCTRWAKVFKVSPNELMNALERIQSENRTSEVQAFYSSLFTLFFEQNPNARDEDLHSKSFLLTAETVYRSGNSKNIHVITIKKYTHEWLDRGSKTYHSSTSAGTLNSFRRAIFYYFVRTVAESR